METLNQRKQKILRAIIHDYLETAEPVGSRHLSQRYKLGVSPATIRNEMAFLEEEEFITHPHTSAGRIPTDKGYRYYVDHLMKTKPLSQKEEVLIDNTYKISDHDLEFIAHQTLSAASNLTHYAAIMKISKGKSKERVYYWGISNIAAQPEFSNAEQLKHILRFFEEEELLQSILHDYCDEDRITIKIGSENKFKEIKDCSVIVTPFGSEEFSFGSIGIIGPTRMFYNHTSSILDHVSDKLGKCMSEIFSGGF